MLAFGRRFVLPSARTGELACARQGVAPPFQPAGVSCPSRAGVWPLPENPSSIARSPDFGHRKLVPGSDFRLFGDSDFHLPASILHFSICSVQFPAMIDFPQLELKWCQNRANNDCHASNVLVIGGRPKAAQEHWFGGRPKAAFIGVFWRACVWRAADGIHRSRST